ncbi:MAG: TlpA family protein disulfide reductase [Deltaproteobacteria bacterium]|nr:TlpA family protein disulfide reductase [Deltaproteobacteria bacterium]
MGSWRCWAAAAALAAAALGVGACGPAATAPQGAQSPSGPTAPDFALPSVEGKTVRLSDYLGKKVILLDFWSTTCDPCLQEMPELVALYERHKEAGLVILGITVDGPDSMAAISSVVHDKKMSFPVLLDEETNVLVRYNPKRELPFVVVIDRTGQVVLKRGSYQAGDEESMRSLVAAVESALGRK